MLYPGKINPGDFVRHVATGVHNDEGVVKVIVVSGNGDLVVEHPSGDFMVCKANELRIADDEAA